MCLTGLDKPGLERIHYAFLEFLAISIVVPPHLPKGLLMFRAWWHRIVDSMTTDRGSRPCRRLRACRLALECLEERITPSTFFVVNSSDNLLPGSLREAISQANLVPDSTIKITSQVKSPIKLTHGELSIQTSMTIENASNASVTIEQLTPNARVFDVSGSSPLNVTLMGGGASTPLIVTGGSVRGDGGGIDVETANSTLSLTHVQVTGNSASQTVKSSTVSGGIGGGIYSMGAVTLNASTITQNQAGEGGGGIGVNDGIVTLAAGSSVTHNQSPLGEGGGISVAAGAVDVGGGSHVDHNSAADVGGIMVGAVSSPGGTAVSIIGGSTVNDNSSTAGAHQNPQNLGGGGIAVIANGNVYISGSQVSGNQTVGMYSGGIVVGLGSITVTDGSQIDGNSDNGPGGGIAANFGGQITVSGGSQVDANTGAAIGGGIVNFSGPAGGVTISGDSQVNDNVLTNGETIGRAILTFLEVVYPNTTFNSFAVAAGGAGGTAMLNGLAQLQQALQQSAGPLQAAEQQIPYSLGVLVAGGGIGVLLAPVSITTGSKVDGNLAGKNVLGANQNLIGLAGGIFQVLGTVTINQSQIDENQAPNGDGGGIWNGGTLTILSSNVSGNKAAGDGGGLFNISGGQTTVQNSTFSGNQASSGGGMANQGALTVTSSIVANNLATTEGGGIYSNGGNLTLMDVVFTNNSPDNVFEV
jgi:hypothetical protein